MAHGICDRCGGKGWRWTGAARVPCTCPIATAPPPDPVRSGYDLIPVSDWQAGIAQRRRPR